MNLLFVGVKFTPSASTLLYFAMGSSPGSSRTRLLKPLLLSLSLPVCGHSSNRSYYLNIAAWYTYIPLQKIQAFVYCVFLVTATRWREEIRFCICLKRISAESFLHFSQMASLSDWIQSYKISLARAKKSESVSISNVINLFKSGRTCQRSYSRCP